MIMIFMIIALLIAFAWDKLTIISKSVHYVLDPTFGKLLTWNNLIGLVIITFIMTLLVSLVQKFTTDQEALRSLKEEQKALQEEMKNNKDNPEKMSEISKKQLALIPKSFGLSGKSIVYTTIPFILLLRWFQDYFTGVGEPKILFFFGWLGSYIIFSIIFSIIIRKVLKIH